MEQTSHEERILRALIEKQHKLIHSSDPTVRFGVLWIAASLDKRLRRCTDLEIGNLMVVVQKRFDIFEPEFAICYHARRRLFVQHGGFEEMKRAVLYVRVSTVDQNPETQLLDLRQFAAQRGFQIIETYTDHGVSGTKARRPALDKMMEDARRHRFDVVVVWACDRLARSTKHLLQVLDELNGFGIQFLSQREAIDTEGPLGRAIIVIISAIAELERSLIVERVRAGMRRAKLEGRQIGRARLDVNREQVITDRRNGMSLTLVARKHSISRASVCRIAKQESALVTLAEVGIHTCQ